MLFLEPLQSVDYRHSQQLARSPIYDLRSSDLSLRSPLNWCPTSPPVTALCLSVRYHQIKFRKRLANFFNLIFLEHDKIMDDLKLTKEEKGNKFYSFILQSLKDSVS